MAEMYNKNCITVDGRMDEPVWEKAKEYTGFRRPKSQGGEMVPAQTFVKFVFCEDRVFVGYKCMEPKMQEVIENHPHQEIWGSDRIELFISPAGDAFDYYQFVTTFGGKQVTNYYAEGGQIQPDPYAPDWKSAVYAGEDYWSLEMEIPLTAFYMTNNGRMRDKWLVNVIRCRPEDKEVPYGINSSCCVLDRNFVEMDRFLAIDGVPMRPLCDDICIASAAADITEKTEDGYRGTMTVQTINAVAGEFVFTSSHCEATKVSLNAGANEFTAPCSFSAEGRCRISLELTREEDGVLFKRYYPIKVIYEPIRLRMTLPEYRNNFYPGQDYSKVVGKVTAAKPVTLKLEGPGIETQVLTPNADGSFRFETPNFGLGEAWLTATIDGYELKKKIRRLAPTGRMMTWISGGNLIVNGEPVLSRRMYSPYYRGGEAFDRRYNADNLHETREICGQKGYMKAEIFLQEKHLSLAEIHKDAMPSEAVRKFLDSRIEENKDRDFAYYYLFDEPECRGVSPVYVKNIYEYVADKDPYHVVMLTTRAADKHTDCADWFETHPYINPLNLEDGSRVYDRPLRTLGKFVDDIVKLNRPDKCIGFLPTCFAYKWKSKYSDYPTLDEIICHTWAAMIHGGKTLDPYAYHDMNDRPALYEGMRYIFSSFEALDKLVLLGERTVLLRTEDVEAVLYDKGDEQMFALVNFTQKPQTVTLENISGTWHEFRHGRTITGNTFELKPLEVLVGTSEVKDADLPTYQEVAALVDKLEYQRTHRGNLLFDRDADIAITASAPTSKYKLFDGMVDNHAWAQAGDMEKFMELDLTKVKPTFNKVVIGGWHIDDMTIQVRNGGELTAPAIAEVKTEEFSTTFILKEAICPEALRLEFPQRRVEVYEIEVF